MKVTIIIPTCSSERIPMLINTVESIQAGTYKDFHIVIVADGNSHIYEVVGDFVENKSFNNVCIISNKERKDWVFSVNRVLKEFDSDYYIYGSDDLTFPPNLIEYAMATMKKRFPDGFGVISIGKKHRAAFGLFGRKWADHFPNRQVFCPDFIHYAGDSELMRTVSKLGKFAFPPERESMVRHARMKDETWRLARRVRNRDHIIRTEREEKGYMWGIDFNLVGRK